MNSDGSPMTSTHMNYLMNPIVMVLNDLCTLLVPKIDNINLNSAKFNKTVGFWSSKFATGFFVGVLIGLFGQIPVKDIFTLGLLLGAFVELFNVVGSWLTSALDPIIQVITNKLNQLVGTNIHFIGLDWAFLSSRPEVWSVANILAPCLIIEAFLLPGNKIIPLGGLIAMGITPSLLVVTRGKVMRMIVIGIVEIPIFLYSATLTAPFMTSMFKNILLDNSANIGMIGSATKEGPIEQLLAIMIGKSSSGDMRFILITILCILAYLLLFYWYTKRMKRRNDAYLLNKQK
jgi:Phosphotransferase system, galactitol-specific IIC component